MSPSRRSSVSSASSESVENECFNLVVDLLHKLQPVSLPALVGHISSKPRNLQSIIGTTNKDVKNFLMAYPEAFGINEKGRVSLLKHPEELGMGKKHGRSSNHTSYPNNIFNGRGEITRLFPTYGFMKCKEPLDVSIYFSSECFGDNKKKPLQDYCLHTGQTLSFDAKLGSPQASAEYIATRVWFVDDYDEEDEDDRAGKGHRYSASNKRPGFISSNTKYFRRDKSHKTPHREEDTGEAFQQVDSTCSKRARKRSLGYIQNVFGYYGFIEEKKNGGNVIFFHKNRIRNCPPLNFLTEVIKKGDSVEFIAVRSGVKQNRLEATDVWLSNGRVAKSSDEEVYVSSPELSIDDDDDRESEEEVSTMVEHKFYKNGPQLLNCSGKIYPTSETTAEIKYGESYKNIVIADARCCDFYYEGGKVEDLNWGFNAGDKVIFDAVKSGSDKPVWNVGLVWTGKKPDVPELQAVSPPDKKDCIENTKDQGLPGGQSPVALMNEDEMDPNQAAYSNWGDSPFPDDNQQACQKEEENFSETSKRNFSDKLANSVDIHKNNLMQDDLLDTEDPEKDSHFRKKSEKFCNKNILQKEASIRESYASEEPADNKVSETYMPGDNNEREVRSSAPDVCLFEDLSGTILKLSRYYICKISCKEMSQPVSIYINVLYHDGVPIKDKCSDLQELLKEGDTVNFNCFVVTDDEDTHWLKVTTAWIGSKPTNFKDYEPKDFINKENLKVSCEVPSWKQFRRSNKYKVAQASSTDGQVRNKLTNSSTELRDMTPEKKNSTKRKFLSAVLPTDEEHDQNETNLLLEEQKERLASSIPEVLVHQFDGILRNMEKLRKKHYSSDVVQDLDSLSLEIESTVNSVLSHFQLNVPKSKLLNKSCQTEPLLERSDVLKMSTCSAEVQTFITGEVISRSIYPL